MVREIALSVLQYPADWAWSPGDRQYPRKGQNEHLQWWADSAIVDIFSSDGKSSEFEGRFNSTFASFNPVSVRNQLTIQSSVKL